MIFKKLKLFDNIAIIQIYCKKNWENKIDWSLLKMYSTKL